MTENPKPDKRILICSPFNNEDHSIDQYVVSLLSLDYPKELIDLVWLENDSNDKTWEKLQKYYEEIKAKYNYHSFELYQKYYGLERLGKMSQNDANQHYTSGKNHLKNYGEATLRAQRLCDIYHFFFTRMTKEHDYFMIFMSDAIPPSNVILRYLEVFELRKDAGWVGAVHHQRAPHHSKLAAPLFKGTETGGKGGTGIRYVTDTQLTEMTKDDPIIECVFTGHVFMIKPKVVFAGAKMTIQGYDIVIPFTDKLREMGLKVYCATDVYLRHISLDGKIYRNGLNEWCSFFSENYNPDTNHQGPHP
jgi:GT2 family glycosyltransferase